MVLLNVSEGHRVNSLYTFTSFNITTIFFFFSGRSRVRALRFPDLVAVARVPLARGRSAALHGALPVPAHPSPMGATRKHSRSRQASTGLHLSWPPTGVCQLAFVSQLILTIGKSGD